jgi:putative SOS response-associated peptidase YedK
MAGICPRDEEGGFNFAILTMSANDVVRRVHDRMPVILPLHHERSWLPPGGTPFFNHFPAELRTSYPVTREMNRASFNDPRAIEPLEPVIT